MKLYSMFFILLMVGCGIDGNPLSPSEKSKEEQKNIFPFESAEQEKNNQEKKKNYLDTSQLELIGNDYNANIGVENDVLDDSFERIKPQSAFPKKRQIIPLRK